ncbi:MAG: hypothetical protein WD042_05665 [Phycisphaeraceae bacterium]
MFRRHATIAMLIVVAAGASHAHAIPVGYLATGRLTYVDSPLVGTFAVGDLFHFIFIFESTTPPEPGSNAFAADFAAVTDAWGTVGIYTASSSGGIGYIFIHNDFNVMGATWDTFSLLSPPLSGPDVGGLALDHAGLYFTGDDTVFSTALDLPVSLNLNDFPLEFGLAFGGGPMARGQVTGLAQVAPSGSAMPEPATAGLALGAAAALALALLRRRAAAPQ